MTADTVTINGGYLWADATSNITLGGATIAIVPPADSETSRKETNVDWLNQRIQELRDCWKD